MKKFYFGSSVIGSFRMNSMKIPWFFWKKWLQSGKGKQLALKIVHKMSATLQRETQSGDANWQSTNQYAINHYGNQTAISMCSSMLRRSMASLISLNTHRRRITWNAARNHINHNIIFSRLPSNFPRKVGCEPALDPGSIYRLCAALCVVRHSV